MKCCGARLAAFLLAIVGTTVAAEPLVAGLQGQAVTLTYNLRNDPTQTLSAIVENGVEFSGLAMLQGFIDVDVDDEGVTFNNYPGNIRYSLPENADDYFLLEFPNLSPQKIVGFSAGDQIAWTSFTQLSFSENWVRLQHADEFHDWPGNSANQYRITLVPEPTTFALLCLAWAALGSRRRRN